MNDAGVSLPEDQLNLSIVADDVVIDTSTIKSAGAFLALMRQQKDFTVQQIADQLKLSARQIIALEADQFDALPKMVIVRGFIRSYAKLLKIDGEPILALLPKNLEPPVQSAYLRPALTTPFLESRLPLMGRQDANNK
ncbi:helix-turn-helix transcriptional regulator, partial [Undibacterium sp. RTI2.1]